MWAHLLLFSSLVIEAEDCKAKAKTWTNKAQTKAFYGGLKATQGQGVALRFTRLFINNIKSR